MKYNLRDILIFTHVARLRSFARASEVLGISKTVVSTRVSELEKLLGISLLARTTREVNLTGEGKVFFDYCNSVLEKVENLDEFLYKHKGISGTLRLALPPYFSRYYIVPHLEEFLRKYPDLKLDILLTEKSVNIILEGYDLQIRIHVPEEEGLQVARLMKNYKVICASKEYIDKFGKPQEPQDLLHHNCLLFGEDDTWRFKHKVSNKIIKLDNISGSVKCSDGEIIKDLLLAGVGIAVKSTIDIESEIVLGKIILLLESYEVINETEFYAVYPAGKYISPKVKAFIDFFQEKLTHKEEFADIEKGKQAMKSPARQGNLVIDDLENSKNISKSVLKFQD
jgi:DNA-binding transcriptional LysR family regulator